MSVLVKPYSLPGIFGMYALPPVAINRFSKFQLSPPTETSLVVILASP